MFVVFNCFQKTEKIGNDLEIDAKAERQHVSQIERKISGNFLNYDYSSTLLRITWQNTGNFSILCTPFATLMLISMVSKTNVITDLLKGPVIATSTPQAWKVFRLSFYLLTSILIDKAPFSQWRKTRHRVISVQLPMEN